MRLGLLLVLLISIVTDFAVYLLIICLGFTKLVNKEMNLLYMRFGCIFVTYQKGFGEQGNAFVVHEIWFCSSSRASFC